MTPSERERRLHSLEGTVRTCYPDPAPQPTELERWTATLSCGALARVEHLCRVMADDAERGDHPMTDLDRGLVECACLDAAEPSSYPHDPDDPEMAELRAQVDDWIAGDRVFMRGADVRAWLIWQGIVVDQLGAGELTRLTALLRVFEDHPVEAAALSTDVIWAAIGERGQRKLHGMV